MGAQQEAQRRLPATLIAATLLSQWGSLLAAVVLVISIVGSIQLPTISYLIVMVLIAVLIGALAFATYQVLSLRWSADASGLAVRLGRAQMDRPWSATPSLRITRPWAYRVLGLARIHLGRPDGKVGRVLIPGIPQSEAEQVMRLWEAGVSRRR
ncbi:hypothetical protein [Serinibacter salmoneus]|uniref:DUF304 domain-containing protein n=1 Tax=Serinibacter salmoneus TaxID=556530 RepID=A0A2A9CVZ4_9MICO|nr:hypothetical protein [Serinibacter salmoneus]PFG18583.1 hypothetical protein ATL40_0123 [Serinibacter salmoneus]